MPFDFGNPRDFHPAEVTHEPFTLEHFIAWAKTRDPAEVYDQKSISDCLICRYGKEHGVRPDECGGYFMQTKTRFPANDYGGVMGTAYGEYLDDIQTVGAALSRARELREGR